MPMKSLIKKTSLLPNALEPLSIPTYEGSGQTVHPSIIDFQNEYAKAQWGGYRFWMAITPYPQSNDAFENPSIFASHDGKNWVVPSGIENPLVSAPGGWEHGFHNDPDLIYNPDDDSLWLYFRFASKTRLQLKLIRICNDMFRNDPLTLMEISPWEQAQNKFRSMCIFRESSVRWHMWGGGGSNQAPYGVYYYFSQDGLKWNAPQICLNARGMDAFQRLGLCNWHMACKPNHKERRVEFLAYAIKLSVHSPKSLLRRLVGAVERRVSQGLGNAIFYAQCQMDTPTLFSSPLSQPVIRPSISGWDNQHLYRCSFQIMNRDGGDYYKVWYSALSKDGRWGLGLTEGRLGTFRSSEK